MRVILVSVGTDGDVFPYVGLGTEMRARGHPVTLVASAQYEALSGKHGFTFAALVSAEENQQLFGHPDFWNPLKTGPLMARWGVLYIERQYNLLATLIADDTVLVANHGVLAAGLIHEKQGVPLVSLVLQPWMIPSSIAPPVMPGLAFLRRAPRFVWQALWRVLDIGVDRLVGPSLNRFRASLSLPPSRHIIQKWLSPQLVVGLFPEWYGPPQTDWPAQMRLTGFPLFDGVQGEELDTPLLEFCQAGTPPVAFTFGTGMAHPAELFRAARAACQLLGLRGIFLTKYKDQLPTPLPPTILHRAYAPFRKLFPRCAAVVHHGGIGTVATAMAAGIPQLICPLCFDQPDNGARVRELGVGSCLKHGANGRRIAKALTWMLTQETRARCRAIASRLANSKAMELTARQIEGMKPFLKDPFGGRQYKI